MMSMQTGAVLTCRLEHVRFHEAFTVESGFVLKLLTHEPPEYDGNAVQWSHSC